MEAQEIWQKPEHSQRFKHMYNAKPTIQVFKSKSSGHFLGFMHCLILLQLLYLQRSCLLASEAKSKLKAYSEDHETELSKT